MNQKCSGARIAMWLVAAGLGHPASRALAQAPALANSLFAIESTHSQVEFTVPFMGLATVKGSFEDFSGAVLLDPGRPANSSVTMVIEASSIHTGNASRDRHLQSSDFFEVARFPVIVFQSDRVVPSPRGFVAEGRLTMHGVTRVISLPFRVRHAVTVNADGLDYAGFDAAMTLNWRDFRIAATNEHNGWFQPAKMLVNDSVRITIAVEATRRHGNKIHYAALDSGLAQLERDGLAGFAQRVERARAQSADSGRRMTRALPDMASAMIERGRSDVAVELARLYSIGRENDADARAAVGMVLYAAGGRDAGMSALREALKLNPWQPQAMELVRRLGQGK